jgi:hypothetical protein
MAAVLALPTITDGTSYPGVMGESGVEHRTETSCRYEKAPPRNSAKRLGFPGARDRVRTGDPQLGNVTRAPKLLWFSS